MEQVAIFVEEIQGQLFAWRSRDSKFLGQGSTVDGLFERLAQDAQGDIMFHVEKDRGGEVLAQRIVREKGELSWDE